MRFLLLTLLILASCKTPVISVLRYNPNIKYYAITPNTVRIAIIDTGIDLTWPMPNICPKGLIDLTKTGIKDTHGHGQNVAHLIADPLKGKDYCLYIIKFHDGRNDNLSQLTRALRVVYKLKPDIVNLSAGGQKPIEEELFIMKHMEKLGIPFIVAAGNSNMDLSKTCQYFPACYKLWNVYVVGNLDNEGHRAETSNYGYIQIWEKGTLQTAGGVTLTGTSQACANATSKIVQRWLK